MINRLAKRGAQAVTVTAWASAAGLAGRIRGLRAEPFASNGRGRVAVIAPHPDDEAAGCAGTLLRHRAAGDTVTVITVTDGRRSRAYGLTPDAMATARHEEAQEAARRLDIDLTWLGFPEGAWQADDAVRAIGAALDACRPNLVYAPSKLDFHPQHRAVAVALGRALKRISAQARVRVYPIQVPLSTSMIDRVTPIGDLLANVRGVLDAYHTQRGALEPCLRLRRYTARLFGLPRAAEGFWELPKNVYSRLHERAGDGGGVRGMRYAAFSDPLAFFTGRRLRRDLVHRAKQMRRAPEAPP